MGHLQARLSGAQDRYNSGEVMVQAVPVPRGWDPVAQGPREGAELPTLSCPWEIRR